MTTCVNSKRVRARAAAVAQRSARYGLQARARCRWRMPPNLQPGSTATQQATQHASSASAATPVALACSVGSTAIAPLADSWPAPCSEAAYSAVAGRTPTHLNTKSALIVSPAVVVSVAAAGLSSVKPPQSLRQASSWDRCALQPSATQVGRHVATHHPPRLQLPGECSFGRRRSCPCPISSPKFVPRSAHLMRVPVSTSTPFWCSHLAANSLACGSMRSSSVACAHTRRTCSAGAGEGRGLQSAPSSVECAAHTPGTPARSMQQVSSRYAPGGSTHSMQMEPQQRHRNAASSSG